MKIKYYRKHNFLRILLACICYIICMPFTIIQLIYFVLRYAVDKRILFLEHDPLSHQVYNKIISYE